MTDTRDRGAASVAAITLCFAFLTGALVWLSRTVDQSLNDRANASAIAFQAARAGAQEVEARDGAAVIDVAAARIAASNAVQRLLSANGDSGSMTSFSVSGDTVTVTVTITTTGRPSSGSASASPAAGFDEEDQ
jgi:hypothetical protein